MDEPRTHYQLSFTVRQAMALFVGLLVALSVAYFLGLMTGLAGREPEGARASLPSPAASEESPGVASETASGEAPRAARAAKSAASVATVPAKLQLFEDRAEEDITRAPAARTATPARVPAAAFWVQVVSVRSEHEARAESHRLSSRGYHATVETVPGPKGSLHRVRVGPYHTREEASRVADRLSRQEKVKAWIAPAGK